MSKEFIPISKPSITELEVKYVTDAIKSTWVSSIGPYIDRFEHEFAKFCGTKHAIAVSNGTVAIHLALVANNIGPGDEVIVPNLSFIATANAVLHSGATPVFVDIEENTLCMSPEALRNSITENTKALIPVHLYGHPANMKEINHVAKEFDLIVIEDAAEAHGAAIDNQKVGSLGHCATFSFYGNKNLTTGEGGMITTNDVDLANQCRLLRDHAMSKVKRYWHTHLGYNYRMTNIQAALGCAQLERVDELLFQRRRIFENYQEGLTKSPRIRLNRNEPWAQNSYWLVCAEVEGYNEGQRDKLILDLKENGIDSRPYFYPMSDMPYIEQNVHTPVTRKISARGINLPTFIDITGDQINYISETIIRLLN